MHDAIHPSRFPRAAQRRHDRPVSRRRRPGATDGWPTQWRAAEASQGRAGSKRV
jgi:hypothetical protein